MDKSSKAEAIIYSSTASATAAAVIPIPVADMVAITGIQISMVLALGALYGKIISKKTGIALISVSAAGRAGESLASLVKTIPGVGSLIGGIAQMSIAGTITYAIGQAINSLLENEKELNVKNLRSAFKKQDKEKIKKQSEKIKMQVRRTKKAEEKIKFYAKPVKFKHEFRLFFNLQGYSTVNLKITKFDGKTVLEKKINPKFKSTKIDSKNFRRGRYLAYLHCDNLIPICIDLERS